MAYYALILAGGSGTRLWPLSRRNRPKPLLPLFGERTMFQVSVERLAPLFTPEQIFVATGPTHLDALREQAPELPPDHFIIEPAGRDTGPAAGLGTLHIYKQDPEAVVAVLTSDHYIGDPARFRKALRAAYTLAERGHIVTLGIAPSFPSSGYAYLKRGDEMGVFDGFTCYEVSGIYEKPDPLTAAEFILSGKYSWNSGMLIWRAGLALEEFRRQQPALGEILDRLAPALGNPKQKAVMERWWPECPEMSVDQAIMAGADNMVIVPVDMGWSDIGSWTTLYDALKLEEGDNVTQGDMPLFVPLRTKGTFALSGRMVVTIGVEDLVIVDTDDVLLICRRDQSEDVRRIVKLLRERGHEDYL